MNKILYIVNVDWFFVSHRLPIAMKAIENGFEVHLACAVTSKLGELEALGIKVHPLNLIRGQTNIFKEIKLLYQFYVVIKKVKPSVVHCVTIKPVLFGNLVARVLKVPVRVSSISGLGYLFISKRFKTKIFKLCLANLYKLALKGNTAVIFHNNSDYKTLIDMGAVSIKNAAFTAGSGVNLNDYHVVDEPTGAPVVMFVARLLIDKGVQEFVQAAITLKKERPEIRMVLVGSIDLGNPQSITQRKLDEWVGSRYIEYWGYSENVKDEISKANIITLPSYREGLPKSLIEAAACGRAIITTDTPGCRDAIIENQTGLLIPIKASDPLVKAILTLIENPALRSQFANRSRQLAEDKFDIKNVIDLHMNIYNQGR